MNSRIEYLKTITRNVTEDIEAYRVLSQTEYTDRTEQEEIFRKAHFLYRFAQEIPVVLDERELLVGSMRFWHTKIPSRNKGHIIVDYRMILREGVGGIKKKIAALNTKEALAFGRAVEAFAVLIQRYADAAEQRGMHTVAGNCRYLSEHAPATFHQALQLIWFVHLFLHAEGMSAAVSFGRFDDYLYPFYRRDMDAGRLTREQAKELLMCFWLKTCEDDESQNLTLGGNMENDLTYLCLEVAAELKVQQPSVSVRINDASSELLWKKTIELVQCGTTVNAGRINLHDVLLAFLDEDKTYADFDDFYSSFRAFFTEKYNTDILRQFRLNWEYTREHHVSPFQSACMGGCLESGMPAEWGGCKYTMAGINVLGIGTLVDSLYAVKKIVFEEECCTYREFVRQVKANFPDKALAYRCKNLEGKYGTDSEETNTMAKELSVLIADLVSSGRIYEGVIPYAGLFVFLGDVNSGSYPATPDGRLQGERISYGVGASDICGGKTITTVLSSAAHIANDRFADGNPLMFSLPANTAAGETGEKLLKILIQSYFEKGGFHLQINITDAEMLKKAKENPQDYSDLIVRISGYSEYFTRLNETIQTALIERS